MTIEELKKMLDSLDRYGVAYVRNSGGRVSVEAQATAPTIAESATVAPDPGEGWRLIDPIKDKPQEGDELLTSDNKWKRRLDYLAPFMKAFHYRRRIESKPSLPDGLPPLPEGAVGPFKGGTFKVPQAGFNGWCATRGDTKWTQLDGLWGGKEQYYCFPADSEVARLNGLGGEPGEAPANYDWQSKAIDSSIEAEELRKQVAVWRQKNKSLDAAVKLGDKLIATLTKERDEAREKVKKKEAERKWFADENQRLTAEIQKLNEEAEARLRQLIEMERILNSVRLSFANPEREVPNG